MNITPVPAVPAGEIPIIKAHTNNQATIVESPKVPAEVTPKPVDEQLSSKYAELAKREKVLRNKIQAREESLKSREAALAAKEADYATSYVSKNKIREMFQKDPTQAMRDFEISGDQITQGILNQPSPQDLMIQKLQSELAELKSAHDQTKNMFDERDKGARAQAIAQITLDVKQLVQANPDFDTIKNTGSEDEVVAYLEKKFDETGTLVSIEVAAEEVEKGLVEELFKYAQLKKIQDRLKPVEVKTEVTPKAVTKTLTHSQVSAPPRALSPRDRAIAMLEGKSI
jgi:hypothetical protein